MSIRVMVEDFSCRMLRRFAQKEKDGWSGYEIITEREYQYRIIKNVINGDYVDAANLCVLADHGLGK